MNPQAHSYSSTNPDRLRLGIEISMSQNMTITAQRHNIKPVFFFIALMMILFCRFSAIGTNTIRSAGQAVHNNCVCNSGSGRHSSGVLFSCFPSCLSVGLIPAWGLSIFSHSCSLLFSCFWCCSFEVSSNAYARFALTSQVIRKRSVFTEVSKWFPLPASRTHLALSSILKRMLCCHLFSIKSKPFGKLLLC